jgi:hypothetical protein
VFNAFCYKILHKSLSDFSYSDTLALIFLIYSPHNNPPRLRERHTRRVTEKACPSHCVIANANVCARQLLLILVCTVILVQLHGYRKMWKMNVSICFVRFNSQFVTTKSWLFFFFYSLENQNSQKVVIFGITFLSVMSTYCTFFFFTEYSQLLTNYESKSLQIFAVSIIVGIFNKN